MGWRNKNYLAVVLTALSVFWVGQANGQQNYTKEQIKQATGAAVELAKNCAEGKFKKVTKTFDTTMLQVMSADRLKTTWDSVVSKVGDFRRLGKTRTDRIQKYLRVFVPCHFQNSSLDLIVVFDPKLKVAGLSIAPAVKTDENGQVTYSLPKYANPESFTEREVEFGFDGWKLPGTLTLPKNSVAAPAVVLVHGSGPNNRDEQIGPNKVFKDIATGLASQGIVVLRYDKRTFVHKRKLVNESSFTLNEETVLDALEAVRFVQKQKEVDPNKVIVLGHSLGGYAIPRIAEFNSKEKKSRNPKIAGFVVMAGCTRPIQTLILQQTKYLVSLDGDISETDKEKITEISDAVKKINSRKALEAMGEKEAVLGGPKSYWLDLHEYRPADLAKKTLTVPTIVMQGGRDYQVTVNEDYSLWKKALEGNSLVQFKKFRSLNHLMMVGKGKPNPQEYQQPGNVSGQVIRHLVKFVKSIKSE